MGLSAWIFDFSSGGSVRGCNESRSGDMRKSEM